MTTYTKIIRIILTPLFGLIMAPFAVIGFLVQFAVAGFNMGFDAYAKLIFFLYEDDIKSNADKEVLED